MVRKLTACILILAMMFLSAPMSAWAADDGPQVGAVRGAVFVHRAGGHNLTAVYRGMSIYDGDVMVTGINSTATIKYYQQIIVMGELTKLSVNSVWQRHGRNNSSITLVEGMVKVRVDVQLGEESRNMVQAAGTIVGVRGTEYILVYRRMVFGDYEGTANPFVRLLVIEGEVVVDLPDPDREGEVASFLVTPQGVFRLIEDIQGRQAFSDLDYMLDMFVVPLESLDLAILEMLRDDPRAFEQNPELFSHIEDAIEWRRLENEIRAQLLPERPAPQIIFASEADEVLPTLPVPTVRGEPLSSDDMPSSADIAAAVLEAKRQGAAEAATPADSAPGLMPVPPSVPPAAPESTPVQQTPPPAPPTEVPEQPAPPIAPPPEAPEPPVPPAEPPPEPPEPPGPPPQGCECAGDGTCPGGCGCNNNDCHTQTPTPCICACACGACPSYDCECAAGDSCGNVGCCGYACPCTRDCGADYCDCSSGTTPAPPLGCDCGCGRDECSCTVPPPSNSPGYFQISEISHLCFLRRNHNTDVFRNQIWELVDDIGSPNDRVTFMIAGESTATIIGANPSGLSGNPFMGTLRSSVTGETRTIYVDVDDPRVDGVTGFIGHIARHSVVYGIRLDGQVQGRNIVGGLIGWSQNEVNGEVIYVQVRGNNVYDLSVINTSPTPTGLGYLIGVASPFNSDAVQSNVVRGGSFPPVWYPPGAATSSAVLGDDFTLFGFAVECEPAHPEEKPWSPEAESGGVDIKEPDGSAPDAKEPEDDGLDIKGPEDDDDDDNPATTEPEGGEDGSP